MPYYYHNSAVSIPPTTATSSIKRMLEMMSADMDTAKKPNVNVDKVKLGLQPTQFYLTQLSESTIKQLMGVDKDNNPNILKNGEVYYLDNGSVEGVTISGIYFKLYGVIHKYKGADLNSIIVREVTPDKDGGFIDSFDAGIQSSRRKFSIPPSMCRKLGIEFKPGYELWPLGLPLIWVEQNKIDIPDTINDDLSFYPHFSNDGSIRRIVVTISGFHLFGEQIRLPNGDKISFKEFFDGLTFKSKIDIHGGDGFSYFSKGDVIPYRVYANKGNGFVSQDGEIVVTLCLNKKTGANKGINPKILNGLILQDFIDVSVNYQIYRMENKESEKASKEVDTVDVVMHHLQDFVNTRQKEPSIGPLWPFF